VGIVLYYYLDLLCVLTLMFVHCFEFELQGRHFTNFHDDDDDDDDDFVLL